MANIEVLSQLIDEEDGGRYRVRVRSSVHYLTIAARVFDEDTMCRPYLLIPSLPQFPDSSEWTTMHITRGDDGRLHCATESTPLPEIKTGLWHTERVDVLSLARGLVFNANVYEVLFRGRPAVVKIACWPFEIPRIANETRAYNVIRQHSEGTGGAALAPEVLAHVTENGRVIGLLLEKVAGEPAGIQDLPACEAAVRRLHSMGLLHGDVDKYNFLVDRSAGLVRVVDLEHNEPFHEETAELELEVLPEALKEEGRRAAQ